MIRIGRVVAGGKVHMHIDGRGCGAARRARITSEIQDLSTLNESQLCRRCFTATRTARAARLNAFSDTRWDADLDLFLARIDTPRPATTTSPERLAQMIAEMNAQFDMMGI